MLKIKIKERTRYATTVAFRNWPPTAQTAAPGWNGATSAGSPVRHGVRHDLGAGLQSVGAVRHGPDGLPATRQRREG